MTVREFVQHLLMNGELDDTVSIEVVVPENEQERIMVYSPFHVAHLDDGTTLIECHK